VIIDGRGVGKNSVDLSDVRERQWQGEGETRETLLGGGLAGQGDLNREKS